MTCAIVGDSIAVGLSIEMPSCSVNAKIGILSAAVIDRVGAADVLIVSAGSNDPRNPHLEANLRAIRAKASAKVVWIVPVDSMAAAAVVRVAATHGDAIVRFAPGQDHVHPKSDKALAASVRAITSNK